MSLQPEVRGTSPKSATRHARRATHYAAAGFQPLLSKQGLAPILDVSIRTLDYWMAQKRIPFLKIAKVVKFELEKVMAALGRYEVIEIGRKA